MRSRCRRRATTSACATATLGPEHRRHGRVLAAPGPADDAVDGRSSTTVHRPILAELARRGTPFIGFLYAGLMLTDDGPVLLECNARLGDPEAQVILPRLAVRARAGARGRGRGATSAASPRNGRAGCPALPGATVGIVLASEGYPGTPKRGLPIEGIEAAQAAGALVFHGGSIGRPGGGYGTNGGRVLTVVGRGAGPAAGARRGRGGRRPDLVGRAPAPARHRGDAPAEPGERVGAAR